MRGGFILGSFLKYSLDWENEWIRVGSLIPPPPALLQPEPKARQPEGKDVSQEESVGSLAGSEKSNTCLALPW